MDDATLKSFIRQAAMGDESKKREGVEALFGLAFRALQAETPAPDQALKYLRGAKFLRMPHENLDYLRAAAFLLIDRHADAVEALKEELRWFPANTEAQRLLESLDSSHTVLPATVDLATFEGIYSVVKPYTMVGEARLRALFWHAQRIIRDGPKGNFVECGVAGGGSSGLLASVLHRLGPAGVRLFCCDSYSGMPEPSEYDAHKGCFADSTDWGTGTCSAPETSVRNLCASLGAEDRIAIVKGFFEETLPVWKDRFGPIAFLHMDGDWYSSTKAILDNLYDALLPGAYIQVDDYGHWEGCHKAVHEFFLSRGVESVMMNRIDYTGVWFTKAG